MGGLAGAPINEAVFLLSKTSPKTLEELKFKFPELKDELKPGIMAGDQELSDEQHRKILTAKAGVVVAALSKTIQMSDKALSNAARNMLLGRRTRLVGQIVTVAGTSGVLAAIGVSQSRLAIIAAVLALLGSLASILGEYYEQVVDRKQGGLNEIFLRIAMARQKAEVLLETIKAYLSANVVDSGLESSIKEANALSEEITKNIFQIVKA